MGMVTRGSRRARGPGRSPRFPSPSVTLTKIIYSFIQKVLDAFPEADHLRRTPPRPRSGRPALRRGAAAALEEPAGAPRAAASAAALLPGPRDIARAPRDPLAARSPLPARA